MHDATKTVADNIALTEDNKVVIKMYYIKPYGVDIVENSMQGVLFRSLFLNSSEGLPYRSLQTMSYPKRQTWSAITTRNHAVQNHPPADPKPASNQTIKVLQKQRFRQFYTLGRASGLLKIELSELFYFYFSCIW